MRYYDDINLLHPQNVDKYSSYRYYSDKNVREYFVIVLLKQMGFSLEEIRNNKDDLKDELFIKQRNKLLKDIITKQNIIKVIDNIRSNITNGEIKIDNYIIDNIQIKKIIKGEEK